MNRLPLFLECTQTIRKRGGSKPLRKGLTTWAILMPVQKIIVFHLRRREKTDVYSKVLVIVLIIKMLRNKEEQVLLVVLRNSDMAFCPVLSVDGNALGTVSCAIVKRYVSLYILLHISGHAQCKTMLELQ